MPALPVRRDALPHLGRVRPGTVGEPLPTVELCVTDLETKEVLPREKMGMLHVAGPIVFPGYLGGEKSPFEEIGGKRWYVTGDLVERDAEGFVTFNADFRRG